MDERRGGHADRQEVLLSLLESSSDAIFAVDREYRYTAFNARHAAVMRALYGVEIALGESLLEYQAATEDHLQCRSRSGWSAPSRSSSRSATAASSTPRPGS